MRSNIKLSFVDPAVTIDPIEEREAIRSELRNAKNPSFVIKNCLHMAESEKDKSLRAGYFLSLAPLAYEIVPIYLVLDIVKLALRTFPRVKMGMYSLINVCSTDVFRDLCGDEDQEYHFSRRNFFFVVAFLILCNYDYRRIKIMLHLKSKLNKDEQEIIAFTKSLCFKLDSTYFSSEDDEKAAKKELYNALCTKLNKRLAAAFTIFLCNGIPPQFIKEYYALKLNDLSKSDQNTAAETWNKDEYLLQIDSLTRNNELLEARVAELQKINEELQQKAELHISNTIPDSLKSALFN